MLFYYLFFWLFFSVSLSFSCILFCCCIDLRRINSLQRLCIFGLYGAIQILFINIIIIIIIIIIIM